MKFFLIMVLIFSGTIPVLAESPTTLSVNTDKLTPGEVVEINGKVPTGMEGKLVAVEIKDSQGNVVLIRTISSDVAGNFDLKFRVPNDAVPGTLSIVTNMEMTDLTSDSKIRKSLHAQQKPELDNSNPICGKGTKSVNGVCHVTNTSKSIFRGGCLVATATYGTELAPQVQMLRELRDNSLLQTESGTVFMSAFNDFYYSFSPIIADYERENPVFREMIKIVITPMISSLSILNYVDMDSETKVLGYGISLILLNLGMYIAIPSMMIMRLVNYHRTSQVVFLPYFDKNKN